MGARFKENYPVRLLNFNYPRSATKAVYDVEMKYIERDVWTRSMSSGPMALPGHRVSGERNQRIMMVDERFADEFIADLKKAIGKAERAAKAEAKNV